MSTGIELYTLHYTTIHTVSVDRASEGLPSLARPAFGKRGRLRGEATTSTSTPRPQDGSPGRFQGAGCVADHLVVVLVVVLVVLLTELLSTVTVSVGKSDFASGSLGSYMAATCTYPFREFFLNTLVTHDEGRSIQRQ